MKSGGIQNELALGAVYDVSAKNPTAGLNSDGKWESLSALLSDANLNTLIPTAVRKGGMSVKFVQSSDNKYVQFRYMSSSTAVADFTNVVNWQGVDKEVINESTNLIESGAVASSLNGIMKHVSKIATHFIREDEWYINLSGGVGTTAPVDTPTQNSGGYSYSITQVQATDKVIVNGTSNGGNPRLWAFIDENNVILSVADNQRIVARDLELTAPTNAAFVVINTNEKLPSYVHAADSLEYKKADKEETEEVILANVHDIKRTDNILVITKSELTKHGKYDINTGEYSTTTQNYYSDEFIVGTAKSLVIKSKRENYHGECVCLFTNNGVIGMQLKSSYQYISLKGVNKIAITAVPEDEFNAILTPALIMADVYDEKTLYT